MPTAKPMPLGTTRLASWTCSGKAAMQQEPAEAYSYLRVTPCECKMSCQGEHKTSRQLASDADSRTCRL